MNSFVPPLSIPRTGSLLASPTHRYGIVKRRRLSRSTYYDALDLTCAACGRTQSQIPPGGLCTFCRQPLTPVLIHARSTAAGPLPDATISQLIALSAGHPSIVPHRAIFVATDYVDSASQPARSAVPLLCTVIAHPGLWGVLVRGRRQRSLQEALNSFYPVAQALLYLHTHRFSHTEVGGASLEGLITVGRGDDVRLADLSTCFPFAANPQDIRRQVERDLLFLANLLTFLVTGKELMRGGRGLLPAPLWSPVERAARGEYASVADMLTDLASLPQERPRALKPSHGQATHPGRQRPRNEDAVLSLTFGIDQEGLSGPIGLYIVADGMGGHDAGDLASQTVSRVVAERLIQAGVVPELRQTRPIYSAGPAALLTQAIQEANGALFNYARQTGSDLGSTITAVLIAGETAFIANVGDSRTYFLREGRLEQVTRDHSIVARLAEVGIIRPEEARTHPRRNEIYRSLGQHPHVDVDLFTRTLRRGDRLILCTDGLWEMVPDDEIQRIVESSRTPQEACDALVEAANRAGGEDNIAVIVVELE
ncbi:MAG: protein phosphatase 2C domain-containing protein [Anaerolineae bacterium]|nr:protein phosphatase 2C domain-containing protein [Anaerolineae bacterium]